MLAAECFIRLGLVDLCNSRFGIDLRGFYPQVKLVIQIFYVICLVLSYSSFIDYLKNFGSVFKDM